MRDNQIDLPPVRSGHRSCLPLDVIDFAKLQPNTIDPMTTGECQGMCGL